MLHTSLSVKRSFLNFCVTAEGVMLSSRASSERVQRLHLMSESILFAVAISSVVTLKR